MLLYNSFFERFVLQSTGTFSEWYSIILQIGCAEPSYRIPTPYSSDARSPSLLGLRWLFGAAHPHAPASSADLVRARHLLSSFYKCPALVLLLRRLSHNYCCSGGHRTTTSAPAAIAQLLLLLRPSHNYCCLCCCSGGYRTTTAAPGAIVQLLRLRRPPHNYCYSCGHRITTAAPAAIAQLLLFRRLSHSQALLHRSPVVLPVYSTDIAFSSLAWMLQSRPPDCAWEGVIHLCEE